MSTKMNFDTNGTPYSIDSYSHLCRFILSCLRYPQCTTLQCFPSSVIEAEPDSSLCTQVLASSYKHVLCIYVLTVSTCSCASVEAQI